jgi:hypothetical protein
VAFRAAVKIPRACCAGNCHIGNARKNLPFSPTRFATLEIDTVSVTEDSKQKATITVPFLTAGSKSAADATFPLRKAAHRSSPGESPLREWNGSGGFSIAATQNRASNFNSWTTLAITALERRL